MILKFAHYRRLFAVAALGAALFGLARPARAESNVLAVARHYLGARNPTGFRGPWCKAFVNLALRRAGRPASRSYRAIAALHDGARVRAPRPGDLVVMRHHVAFFLRFGGRGVVALGGNQGRRHRVTVSSYPRRRVIAFVRPFAHRRRS